MKGVDNTNSTITPAMIAYSNTSSTTITSASTINSESNKGTRNIEDSYGPSDGNTPFSYSRPSSAIQNNADRVLEGANSTPQTEGILKNLKEGIRIPDLLQVILSELKKLIKNDHNYRLEDREQLKNLSATLNSRNFNRIINLKEEVLDLFCVFKNRGSVLDGDIQENIDIYCQNNKNKHKPEIDDFIQKSDSEEQQKLFAAIYRRAKLLSNMVKLSPNSLNLEDIANFIELFGGASTLKTHNKSITKLDQLCKDLKLALKGADDYEADYHNGFNQRRNSCYLYQALDVSYIQNEMIQPYLGQFTIHEPIGDGAKIDQALKELLSSVNGDKPTLCVYNLGDSHWVTFAALKKDDGIVILYKDSLGVSNQVFKEKIKGLSTGSKLTFITNNRKEQTSGVDCCQ